MSRSHVEYTLILQNFYENRQKYWPAILKSIKAQSIPPKEIIIWDNLCCINASEPGLTVVSSGRNTLMGRYTAVWMAETDLFVFQDNDLLLGPDTIQRLINVARCRHTQIVGILGMKLNRKSEHPYTDGRAAIGECDVVLGRAFACHRKALWPGFEAIHQKYLKPGRADDILFSMASRNAWAIAAPDFTNLDEEGIGLCHEDQHLPERNAFVKEMMALGF